MIALGHLALMLLFWAGSAVAADTPSDTATRALLRAADTGSLARVEEALGQGARIDESRISWAGPDGQPALVAAALRGHARIVSFLLENGADPLVTEKDGFNVWHAAAFQGQPAVLRVLIDAGVPGYGISERDGFTPLHRASWGRARRHFEAVKLLVTSGGRACDEPDRAGRPAAALAKSPQSAAWLTACRTKNTKSVKGTDGSGPSAVMDAPAPGTSAAETSRGEKGAR